MSDPVKDEKQLEIFMEGTACEIPCWAFSKKRSTIEELRIDYPDKTFAVIESPKGMPSVRFPGYLDAMLSKCQKDLFGQNYCEISVYQILQTLGLDPQSGYNYRRFKEDLERAFSLVIKTDRFRDPETGERCYTTYYRLLDTMELAHRKNKVSRFFFNHKFLESLRSGYLRYLDYDFCLELDQANEALARFLYQHLVKRIGAKNHYSRRLDGFLSDIGQGHILQQDSKRKKEYLKRTLFPALDLIVKAGKVQYQIEEEKRIVFFPPGRAMSTKQERDRYVALMLKKMQESNKAKPEKKQAKQRTKQPTKKQAEKRDRAMHEELAEGDPQAYVNFVEGRKRSGSTDFYDDIYRMCLELVK